LFIRLSFYQVITGKFLAVAVDGFGNDVVSCLAELVYPGCKSEAPKLLQSFYSGEGAS
jgi:hypothetical protein